MGNCLKKNKVEPLEAKESSDTKSGQESPVKRPGSAEKAEMVRPGSAEKAEMVIALKDEGKEAQVADGGLAFVVDFTHSKKAKKPKLTGKKGRNGKGDHVDEDLPSYSVEEKALMADILRESQLKERSEKAKNVDIKIDDAKRRRMMREAQAEALRAAAGKGTKKDANSVSPDDVAASEI